jgi:hypothetical protein
MRANIRELNYDCYIHSVKLSYGITSSHKQAYRRKKSILQHLQISSLNASLAFSVASMFWFSKTELTAATHSDRVRESMGRTASLVALAKIKLSRRAALAKPNLNITAYPNSS